MESINLFCISGCSRSYIAYVAFIDLIASRVVVFAYTSVRECVKYGFHDLSDAFSKTQKNICLHVEARAYGVVWIHGINPSKCQCANTLKKIMLQNVFSISNKCMSNGKLCESKTLMSCPI